MLDWTDRHFRYFIRLITKRSLLYTEMIHTGAIIYGDKKRFLEYSQQELPLAIQFGGDNPAHLGECAKIAEDFGYTEVNLNVGCPSERVQSGNFGACLMAKPDLVAKCMESMISKVSIPVTVKHRIGIDGKESYEDMYNFVKVVSASGCKKFIVHARIAILGGLSPEENRKIPPLRYEDVYRLKQDFPHLHIEINGGIRNHDSIQQHLQKTDSVMIGRLAYEDPLFFKDVDSIYYGMQFHPLNRKDILLEMIPYLESHISNGGKLNQVLRHIMGLFHGVAGAKKFRRFLSENMYKSDFSVKSLEGAVKAIEL